nr:transposase [Nocardia inohanensis]
MKRPLVVVCDNPTSHTALGMRAFAADADWLTVYQLPTYAPDLNPVEGIWSVLRRSLANTIFTDPDHLTAAVRTRLRRIQHRPNLIDGCLTGTGLNPIAP